MADARTRSLQRWLEGRAVLWRAITGRADRLAAGRATPDDVLALPADYRAIARDVSAARLRLPGARGTQALDGLYSRLHGLLDREWRDPRDLLRIWLTVELPAAFVRVRRHVLWVTMLFVAAAVAGAWLVATHPELGGLFLDEGTIERVEAGVLWTDGLLNVVPSSLLSVGILANNVAVTLTAFALGLLFGLGTLYIVALNGLMLGAVFAFTAQHGLGDELARFVVAHGCVELSVICLAGGAGSYVGEALLRPAGRPRAGALRDAMRDVMPLLLLSIALLVLCGIVEGYVSPDPSYPWATRVAIGVGLWIVMAGLLAGVGRRE